MALSNQCKAATNDKDTAYEIQQFTDTPGIFYEEVGTLTVTQDTWNLVIHLDLKSLRDRELRIKHNLGNLEDLCRGQGKTNFLCSVLNQSIGRMNEKIEKEINLLHDLLGANSRRKRRGLIDGLGAIVKSITGNMDATDAKRINKAILAVQYKQKSLEGSMKEQIQIIQTTFQIFNQTSSNIEENQKALKDVIKKIEDCIKHELSAVIMRQRLDEHIIALGTIVEALLDDVKDLVNFISNLSQGILNPGIISPNKLIEYLANALPHLPKGSSFPTQIIRGEGQHLLQLAEIKAFSRHNAVVLVVEIPLVGLQEYRVSKAYPLPTRVVNSTYQYIETTADPVVIDREHNTYIKMTDVELGKCKRQQSKYICKPQHPSLTVNDNSPCEVLTYLNLDSQHTECAKRIVPLKRPIIIAMRQSGRWLFVAPTIETVAIKCKNRQKKFEKLQGSGILALVGKCTVTAKDFKIETINTITQEEFETYLPPFNLTLSISESEVIPKVEIESKKLQLKNVINNPQELNEIGIRIQQIKSDLDKKAADDTQHYTTVGGYSLGTIVFIILVAFVIYKYISKKRTTVEIVKQPEEVELKPCIHTSVPRASKRKSTLGEIKVGFRRNKPTTSTM